MNHAELSGSAIVLADQADSLALSLEKLYQSTDDEIALKRFASAIGSQRIIAGYLRFIGERAAVQHNQDERQKAEIIRQYRASLEARGCVEVGQL